MKLKCIRQVTDKHTGEVYKAGGVYEFEGERAEEIARAVNYFEKVDEPEEPPKEEPKPKPKAKKKATKK